jgi:hypothetical protein
MNSRQLAAYCASRPAAVEDHPWGASPTVFKVGGPGRLGQRFAFCLPGIWSTCANARSSHGCRASGSATMSAGKAR